MASKRIVTVPMMKYSEPLLRVMESGHFRTSLLALKAAFKMLDKYRDDQASSPPGRKARRVMLN